MRLFVCILGMLVSYAMAHADGLPEGLTATALAVYSASISDVIVDSIGISSTEGYIHHKLISNTSLAREIYYTGALLSIVCIYRTTLYDIMSIRLSVDDGEPRDIELNREELGSSLGPEERCLANTPVATFSEGHWGQ